MSIPTSKRNLENVPVVIQKNPTRDQNASAIVGREKNVFLGVDNNPTLTYQKLVAFAVRFYIITKYYGLKR